MWRLKRGRRITRHALYAHLAEMSSRLRPVSRCLCISRSTDVAEVLGVPPAAITEANYPEHKWHDLAFEDGSFDMIVSNQVLEHVDVSPSTVFEESMRVLAPGGYLVVGTVFNYPIHRGPHDMWRFTPEALELLCQQAGFSRVVETGGWGNQYVWLLDWLGLLWEPVPIARWHPVNRIARRNDTHWPIVVWVIAQK